MRGITLFFFFAGIGLFLFVGAMSLKSIGLNWRLQDTYLHYFRETASYVSHIESKTGTLPTYEELQSWAQRHQLEDFTYTVSVDRLKCRNPNFAKEEMDRFVLSFWAGEAFECYAAPSGKTTLNPQIGTYISSTLAIVALISVSIAALLSFWCFNTVRKWSISDGSSNIS